MSSSNKYSPEVRERAVRMVLDLQSEHESESHNCGDGCECAIGEPVAVASRTQYKKASDGTCTAWCQVALTQYRSTGECMPASDELPDGVRGA